MAQRRCRADSRVALSTAGHNSPALGGVLGAVISTIRFSRRVPLWPISSTWGPFPFHSSRRSCSKAKVGVGGHTCLATALPSSPVPSVGTPGHSSQGTSTGGSGCDTAIFVRGGIKQQKKLFPKNGSLLKETFSLPPFWGHPSSSSLQSPALGAVDDSAELSQSPAHPDLSHPSAGAQRGLG